MPTEREKRLMELKARIDDVHETVLRALRMMDETTIDRAMNEQHALLQEYAALLKTKG